MVEAGPGAGAGAGYLLPAWAQGDWGRAVIAGGSVVWQDEAALAVYRLTAVSGLGPDQYLVRVSSDCGHSGYSCLALERWGQNNWL